MLNINTFFDFKYLPKEAGKINYKHEKEMDEDDEGWFVINIQVKPQESKAWDSSQGEIKMPENKGTASLQRNHQPRVKQKQQEQLEELQVKGAQVQFTIYRDRERVRDQWTGLSSFRGGAKMR